MLNFRIRTTLIGVVLAAGLSLGSVAHELSPSDNLPPIVYERHDAMIALGSAMRQIKLYVDGRGSQEAATRAANTLTDTAARLLSLFPKGSGMDVHDKSGSKPVIWEKWNDFQDATTSFGARAEAVKSALSGEDADALRGAFADLGRIGCGGCHRVFRQKM